MQQDLEREGLKNTDGEIGLEQEEEYFILVIRKRNSHTHIFKKLIF